MKRWGEYVAVVGTAVFIPLEIYELARARHLARASSPSRFNVFAVVYILWTKRLFGFRGGRAAFEAERHSESLLEVERAELRCRATSRATRFGLAASVPSFAGTARQVQRSEAGMKSRVRWPV